VLLNRNKLFYYSEGHFDFNGKQIFVYLPPISDIFINRPSHKDTTIQQIPDWLDILHDIASIPEGTEASTIDCFKSSTGNSKRGPISGRWIANTVLNYVLDRTDKNYNKLVLPLSAPMDQNPGVIAPLGVRRVDTESLVLLQFHSLGERFIPDNFGWKTDLVVETAYTPIHHDHWLAGQVMAHLHGHKICFSSNIQNFVYKFTPISSGFYPHPTRRTWTCGLLTTFTNPEM
jgi:hypothetical protein